MILSSLTEAKRNWTFALRGRTNSRQSAVSLINSLMIWYSPLRAMKKGMICTNYPRLTLPREHFKLHYYALCKPARLICSNGDDEVNHIVRLHRERRFTRRRRLSLLHLLCKCGAHLRVGAALDRSRYNKNSKDGVFSSYSLTAVRFCRNPKGQRPFFTKIAAAAEISSPAAAAVLFT